MSSPNTPAAVIGLELDGKGFEGANAQLNKHAEGWEKIAGYADRASGAVDRMVGRIAGIAGVAGIGVIVSDLARLEDQAARTATAVGQLGGRNARRPFEDAYLNAGIKTGFLGDQIAAGVNPIIARIGGRGLTAGGAGQLGTFLGDFGRAYGMDPAQAGSAAAELGLFGRARGPLDTQQLLAVVANQAARSGNEATTAQFLQSVTGTVGMLSGAHPNESGRSTATQIGALYGAVSQVNGQFRDPGIFGAGVAGIDSAVTGAYRNPRLEAALQMAGIGYRDQRGGLAGPHGKDVAQKLLRYSEQTYGKGSIEQDLFLRSNFGDVSADMLEALASGQKTYNQLLHPDAKAGAKRAHDLGQSNKDTITGHANSTRGSTLKGARKGGLEGVIDSILGLPAGVQIAAALLGPKAAGLGAKGIRALARKIAGRQGAAAIGEDGAAAAADAFLGGGAAAAVEGAAGSAAATTVAEGVGLTAGAVLALPITAAGFFFSHGTHDLDKGAAMEARNLARQDAKVLEKKFGKNWVNNKAAISYARKHGMIDVVGKDPMKSDWWLRGAIQDSRKSQQAQLLATASQARPLSANPSADKFDHAVDKFERIIKQLLGHSGRGGHAEGAAFGGLNAAGSFGMNDVVGQGMVFASFMQGASSGGGSNTSFAAFTTPGGGSSGSGGGGTTSSDGSSTGSTGGGSSARNDEKGWERALNVYNSGKVGSGYGVSKIKGLASQKSGDGAHKGDRKIVQNAANSAGIPFWVLWGVYGAESSWGQAGGFGLTAAHGRGGYTGDISADANESARLLAKLYDDNGGKKTQRGSSGGRRGGAQPGGNSGGNSNVQTASVHAASAGGGGGGAALAAAHAWMAGGAPAGVAGAMGTGAHIHVHLDGRKIDETRARVRGRV